LATITVMICRLSPDVINKIAAGEVIENPASVVKELVENSLDAAATEIVVEIKGGGRQLIRITDNGCGMDKGDAVLCLERHATSKMKGIDDLSSLSTMGFRGEAIASIAAISKFKLVTRRAVDPVDQGTLVVVEGGSLLQSAPAACSVGTTIDIQSLFYNVPVRKKFLKSPAQDGADVFKLMSVMALGHPDVSFQLIRDGKQVLKAPGGPLQQRKGVVLGGEFLEACLPVESGGIVGFVGNPSYTRHNRLGQYLYLNGRAVVSPVISRAVQGGFGTTIPPQRYPVFVLHWEMPTFDVDVNVHPQKREVRLKDEEVVIQTVRDAISLALRPKEVPRPAVAPTFTRPEYTPAPAPAPMVHEAIAVYTIEEPEIDLKVESLGPTVLTTIKGYIVAEPEEGDGFLLVDQKRAHHRVLFEKMKESSGSVATQSLSIPIQIDLTPVEAEVMRQSIDRLDSLGFSLRDFGRQAFLIDTIPQSFSNNDVKTMIKGIMEDLQVYPAATEGVLERQLVSIALRGAISSKTKLSLPEAQELIKQLWNGQVSLQCPSGQQIWVHLNSEKLREIV